MILQGYILRQLVVTFLFTFLVMISVFSIGTMVQSMRMLGEAWIDYLSTIAPTVFIFVSPWALLVASTTSATLVYGRLSADNEIDAVRASGIHTNVIILPGLFFSIVIAGMTFVISQELLPRAIFARRNVAREAAVTVLRNPPPGKQTLNLGDEGSLSYLDTESGILRYPVLTLYAEGQLSAHFQSKEARIILVPGQPPVLELVEGQFSKYGSKGEMTEGKFGGDPIKVPLPLDTARIKAESSVEMTADELSDWISPAGQGRGDYKAWAEYYGRMGRTIAPVMLILIAIPLGMWVKKGSRLAGLGMALPPLLLYIVLMFAFQGLGNKARVSPEIAGFAPSAILTLIAAMLMGGIYRR